MNNKQYLKKQILQKELQIKRLQEQNSSLDICNSLFNTLILEKAVLKKELENLDENSFINKIKNKFSTSHSRKEKLICDYFKN